MTIKPLKSDTVMWLIMAFLVLPASIMCMIQKDSDIKIGGFYFFAICCVYLPLLFDVSFSMYYVDKDGIREENFLTSRSFSWNDFKFIGYQRYTKGSKHSFHILCLTKALPRDMTQEKFQKTFFRRKYAITLRYRNEDFYQEFLYYCGGERDIRE